MGGLPSLWQFVAGRAQSGLHHQASALDQLDANLPYGGHEKRPRGWLLYLQGTVPKKGSGSVVLLRINKIKIQAMEDCYIFIGGNKAGYLTMTFAAGAGAKLTSLPPSRRDHSSFGCHQQT